MGENTQNQLPISDTPSLFAPSPGSKGSGIGCGKAALFLALTVLVILIGIEAGWRLVCTVGLTIPPTRDRSQIQEWEWVWQHRKGHGQIFEDTIFRFDPGLGWFPKPNYRSDGVNTNIHGQRGVTDWPIERQSGVKRILCIGDSYTFGFQVRDEESFSEVLRSRYLPGAEVINWGVPGYGTDQQVLLFERDGVQFKPDIVLLGFYTRDLFRNDTWFRSYAKPMFEIHGGQLALVHDQVPSPTELLSLYNSGQKRIAPQGLFLVEYGLRTLEKLKRRALDEQSEEWLVTSAIIRRFQESAQQIGAKPYLLIIPHDEILEKESSATHDTARLLKAESARIGMECLDLIPILLQKAAEDPRPLYKGHLSPWGHEVTAAAIQEHFRRIGWF